MIFTWKSTSEQIATASAPTTNNTSAYAFAAGGAGAKQESIFDLKLPRFLRFRRRLSGATYSSVEADDGDELVIGNRMTKSVTGCSPRSGKKITEDRLTGKHGSGTDSTMVNVRSKPMSQSLSLTPMLNRKLIICGSKKGKSSC